MTDFTSATPKIARADAQIGALVTNMDALCTAIKGQIDHDIDEDANTQAWVYRGATPVAPVEWSVRIGEILYNLRSALDHIVWQLVLANGESPGRGNEFPVVDDRDSWQRVSRRRLEGVGDRARELICRMQPFTLEIGIQPPFDIDVYAFWKLQCLCNIDKHRHLNLCVVETNGIGPVVFGENQPPVPETIRSRPLGGTGGLGKIESGMTLLCLNDAGLELRPDFRTDVRFDYPEDRELVAESVPVILDQCFRAVRGATRLLRSLLRK